MTLRGYFKFYNNSLIYYPSRDEEIPHKIKVLGTWKLDKNHNLIFIVDKSQNSIFGNTIKFETKVEKASKHYLSFSMLRRISPTFRKISRVYFRGQWKTNKLGKLIFSVKGDKEESELEFKSGWELTRDNQIIYIYKKKYAGKQTINSFILKGRWKVRSYKLIYYIEDSRDSRLIFDVSLSKVFILPKKNKIDIGVGFRASGKKRRIKTITLNGSWRFKKTALEFITKFGKGLEVWKFKVKRSLGKGKEITLALVDEKDKPLGFEAAFFKKISKEGRFFVKGKWGHQKEIKGGLYFSF